MKKQLVRIMALVLGLTAAPGFTAVKAEEEPVAPEETTEEVVEAETEEVIEEEAEEPVIEEVTVVEEEPEITEEEPEPEIIEEEEAVEVYEAVTTFTVGNYTYDVSSGTAKVTAYKGKEASVSVPNTVTYQGDAYKVTAIDEDVFAGNTSMTSVTLPKNVKSVGNGAFYDCVNLSSVTINGDLANCDNYLYYGSRRPVFFNAGTNTSGITVTFGSGVLRVPNYLFCGGNNSNENNRPKVKKVVLPDSITEIGEGAFNNCQYLDTINWPADLVTIGGLAFTNAAFTSITFPSKLSVIDNKAFSNCRKIEKLVFPKSLTEIGSEAFKDTVKLNSISFNSDFESYYYMTPFGNAGSEASALKVTFGSNMTEIPKYLFEAKDGIRAHITEVVMANTITNTNYSSFDGCEDLTKITWSSKLEYIDAWSFMNTGITELKLPATVSTIEVDAFKDCRKLKTVVLPTGLKNCYSGAFMNCVNLSSIEINSDFASTPNYFVNDYSMPFGNTGTNAVDGIVLKVNTEVTKLPKYLFATGADKGKDIYCHLTKVILTNTLEEIGDYCFYHCYDLKEVDYAGTKAMWNALKLGKENTDLANAHFTFRNQAVPKPPTPKLLATYNGAKGIGIKWQIVPNADSYQIWRKYKGTWSRLATVKATDSSLQASGSTLMYTDTSVKTKYGEGYIYSVAAVIGKRIGDYNKTGLAAYRLINPKFTKATPTGSGKVTLAWNSVACHGYEVQYATEAEAKKGNWTKLPQTTKTTLTVSGLKKGVKYVFRIRCQKTNKDRGTTWSEYSPWISAMVK